MSSPVHRLAGRVATVYRERGARGVATQTRLKIRYWFRVLTFRPHVIHKCLAGQEFCVAINNLFAQGWVQERANWPELEWIKDNLLEEGDYVLDCGANNGFTTVFFARFVGPTGKVTAFEPLPSNAADIRQNILLNELSNVRIEPVALGSAPGVVQLLAMPNGVVCRDAGERTISVPIVRLDDVVADGIPTLLKIDVEGYEAEVLEGAVQILKHRPKLDIEVHPFLHSNALSHCESVFQLIEPRNYKLFVQREIDGIIRPFDLTQVALQDLALQHVFHIYARPRI